jgi:peptidoglycan/LPS O-acetylase OafA/YrhL
MGQRSETAVARRIPTLDGWRGIAILLVILSHFQDGYLPDNFFGLPWLSTGQLGVTIFFVLSGFLITSKLFTEDRINLFEFYRRRAFRILPAAWTYLLVLCLLTAVTPLKVITFDLWPSVLFFRNYVIAPANISCTEQFWTLAIEEQFYFVWPIMLLLLKRKGALIAAILGVVGLALFKTIYWSRYYHIYITRRTEIRVDAIIVGCLLAFLLENRKAQDWFTKHGSLLFSGCLLPLAWDQYHFQHLIPTHEAIVIGLMIGATVSRPAMVWSRFFEMSHLKTTGMFSYSLYLWQGLFFHQLHWGVYGIVLTPMAMFASWFLIEKPGIELGQRGMNLRGLLGRMASKSAMPEPVEVG